MGQKPHWVSWLMTIGGIWMECVHPCTPSLFSVAFDTISHSILWEVVDVGGPVLRWVESFISNMTQKVLLESLAPPFSLQVLLELVLPAPPPLPCLDETAG